MGQGTWIQGQTRGKKNCLDTSLSDISLANGELVYQPRRNKVSVGSGERGFSRSGPVGSYRACMVCMGQPKSIPVLRDLHERQIDIQLAGCVVESFTAQANEDDIRT